MATDTKISSADDRADRRRQHLLDESDAPGESLYAGRRREKYSSEGDGSRTSVSAL